MPHLIIRSDSMLLGGKIQFGRILSGQPKRARTFKVLNKINDLYIGMVRSDVELKFWHYDFYNWLRREQFNH